LTEYMLLTLIDSDKQFECKFYHIPSNPVDFVLSNQTAARLGYELRRQPSYTHIGQDDTLIIDNKDTWDKLNYFYNNELPSNFDEKLLPKIEDKEIKQAVIKIFNEYPEVIAKSRYDVGTIADIEYEINIKPNAVWYPQLPYPLGYDSRVA